MGFDDLRRTRTDMAFRVATPRKRVSSDHIDEPAELHPPSAFPSHYAQAVRGGGIKTSPRPLDSMRLSGNRVAAAAGPKMIRLFVAAPMFSAHRKLPPHIIAPPSKLSGVRMLMPMYPICLGF